MRKKQSKKTNIWILESSDIALHLGALPGAAHQRSLRRGFAAARARLRRAAAALWREGGVDLEWLIVRQKAFVCFNKNDALGITY